jgi:hypothetical protein
MKGDLWGISVTGDPTGCDAKVTEKVKYSNKIRRSTIASSNILRFPRASGEPPRTTVLRGLADLLLPAGVSVYSRCFVKWKNKFLKSTTFSVTSCGATVKAHRAPTSESVRLQWKSTVHAALPLNDDIHTQIQCREG